LLAAIALLLVLGALTAAPAYAQNNTVQVLAVGDSITTNNGNAAPGYGGFFVAKFEERDLGKAHYIGQASTSPCATPWASWIRTFPKPRLDYVVLQDEFVMDDPNSPCASKQAWRAAWQDVVDAAKEKGAFVIVLDGHHPDLSSVTGIDVLDHPVPSPDFGDGVHYTSAGYKLYAKNVVHLLKSYLPDPEPEPKPDALPVDVPTP
jgi:lysophospholipase L1-like esterase